MHASHALLLAVAGLAAAQSSTSAAAASTSSAVGTSGCGSQIDDIIASCLGTTQAQLQACTTNDWDCLCEQTNNVLTCYNNCPSDPRRNGVEQQSVSYCNAAKAYGSSTSSSMMSMTATASGSSMSSSASASASDSASAASATSASGSGSPSATTSSNSESASASQSSSAASPLLVPGSLIAAIFGLVAAL